MSLSRSPVEAGRSGSPSSNGMGASFFAKAEAIAKSMTTWHARSAETSRSQNHNAEPAAAAGAVARAAEPQPLGAS